MSSTGKDELTRTLPSTRDEHALNDTVPSKQTQIVLTDDQWLLFTQALDRPARPKPHLEALFQTKGVFD